ncbi:hypothetical protein CZ765_04755 [Corynebacterium casei]|nr:hypothetical protein CZ765_04755 [Corynebacterium casei]
MSFSLGRGVGMKTKLRRQLVLRRKTCLRKSKTLGFRLSARMRKEELLQLV